MPSPARPRRIVTVTAAGQVTVSSARLIWKRSLVNSPPSGDGCWVSQRASMPLTARWFQELAGAVGGVAVHDRLPLTACIVGGAGVVMLEPGPPGRPANLDLLSSSRLLVAPRPPAATTVALDGASTCHRRAVAISVIVDGLVVGEVVDQIDGDSAVAGVAGSDSGVGDDLAVRVDRYVPLVAVEPTGRGLVAVRVLGSTVEITRLAATRLAMRNMPSSASSRSWPTMVANSAAALAASPSRMRPSSTRRHP